MRLVTLEVAAGADLGQVLAKGPWIFQETQQAQFWLPFLANNCFSVPDFE